MDITQSAELYSLSFSERIKLFWKQPSWKNLAGIFMGRKVQKTDPVLGLIGVQFPEANGGEQVNLAKRGVTPIPRLKKEDIEHNIIPLGLKVASPERRQDTDFLKRSINIDDLNIDQLQVVLQNDFKRRHPVRLHDQNTGEHFDSNKYLDEHSDHSMQSNLNSMFKKLAEFCGANDETDLKSQQVLQTLGYLCSQTGPISLKNFIIEQLSRNFYFTPRRDPMDPDNKLETCSVAATKEKDGNITVRIYLEYDGYMITNAKKGSRDIFNVLQSADAKMTITINPNSPENIEITDLRANFSPYTVEPSK